MEIVILSFDYCAWHYSQALEDFFDVCANFLFLIHRTFSLPAKRINQQFPRWPGRILGIVRAFLSIFAGFLITVIAFIIESILLLIWILLPLILLGLFYAAIRSIFVS